MYHLTASGAPLSFPPSLLLSLSPFLSKSPSLAFSLSLFPKRVFGVRPGMMSMPPSAEQRGVSIQSQGSVCAWVSECVCARVCVWVTSASSKIDYSAGIYYSERWEEWACMCQKQKGWGRREHEGETARRHLGVYWGFNIFALKVSRRQGRRFSGKGNNWDQVLPSAPLLFMTPHSHWHSSHTHFSAFVHEYSHTHTYMHKGKCFSLW